MTPCMHCNAIGECAHRPIEAHRLAFPDPPVSRQRRADSAAPVRSHKAPPAVVVTSKRTTAAPQRAARLKAAAVEVMRGRAFTSGDLAAALGKGRRSATAVLNSWMSLGIIVRSGERKERSGQTATVWRFAPGCDDANHSNPPARAHPGGVHGSASPSRPGEGKRRGKPGRPAGGGSKK